MNAQVTHTPRAGKTLTIFADGGFEVSEYVPYENWTYFGPACYYPVSEKVLREQIEFYRAIGGDEAIIDRRARAAIASATGAQS